jgi:hypothetical protein
MKNCAAKIALLTFTSSTMLISAKEKESSPFNSELV